MMKALVIEDDYNTAEIICLGLKMLWPDAQPVSTPFGHNGIEMVKSEAPNIVILDLGLPDMSGFEVLRQIRESSRVPVLMLTLSGEEDHTARALELGANDYMVKPFSHVVLQKRMKALLTTSEGSRTGSSSTMPYGSRGQTYTSAQVYHILQTAPFFR